MGLLAHLLLASAVLLPFGGSAHRRTEEGNRQYLDGAYEEALRLYTEAQVDAPQAAELFYDIGNVLYRQGDFEGAAEAYTRALLMAPEELVAPSAYNLGNARYELDEFQRVSARIVDPDDLALRTEYEYAGGAGCSCGGTPGMNLITKITECAASPCPENGNHVTYRKYDQLDRLIKIVRKVGPDDEAEDEDPQIAHCAGIGKAVPQKQYNQDKRQYQDNGKGLEQPLVVEQPLGWRFLFMHS